MAAVALLALVAVLLNCAPGGTRLATLGPRALNVPVAFSGAGPGEAWACVIGVPAGPGKSMATVNDAMDMEQQLDALGYEVDARYGQGTTTSRGSVPAKTAAQNVPTWVNIQSCIHFIQNHAQPNQIALFYVSSHGFRSSTWPSGDEPDGVSEGLILAGGAGVSDDQIAEALASTTTPNGFQPDVYVTAIFDSCYAGGMLDGADDPGARLRAPSSILTAVDADHEAFEFKANDPGKKDPYAPGEIGAGTGLPGTQNGLFTNYLLKGLGRPAPAGPGMVASLACPSRVTTPADAEGDDDCVTTAQELFNYAKGRTAAARDDPGLVGKPQVPSVASQQIPQLLIKP